MSFIDRYEDQLLVAARERTERAARRRRLRLPAIGFGGVLAAGLGAAAILLTPAGDKLTPVQEAIAALGPAGGMVHFEMTQVFSAEGYPPTRCDFGTTEVWMATTGDTRTRVRQTPSTGADCRGHGNAADGAPLVGVIDDAYGADGSTTTYIEDLNHGVVVTDARKDQPFSISLAPGDGSFLNASGRANDPQAQIRALLGTRGLRDQGVSIQEGRKVRTFVVPAPRPKGDDPARPQGAYSYVVDAETFAPLSVISTASEDITAPGGQQKVVKTRRGFRFLSWETLPLDTANERLLEVRFPADAQVTTGDADYFSEAPAKQRREWSREAKALLEQWQQDHPAAAAADEGPTR